MPRHFSHNLVGHLLCCDFSQADILLQYFNQCGMGLVVVDALGLPVFGLHHIGQGHRGVLHGRQQGRSGFQLNRRQCGFIAILGPNA